MPETIYVPDPRAHPLFWPPSRNFDGGGSTITIGDGNGNGNGNGDELVCPDPLNAKEFWIQAGLTSGVHVAGYEPANTTNSQAATPATSAGLLVSNRFSTQAVADNQAFYSANTDDVFFNHRTTFYVGARLDQTSGTRCWIGFVDGAASGLRLTDTPAVSVIAFRASSAVPDSFWQAVVGDGASQTVESTAVAVSTTVTQHFRIEWSLSATEVRFYIDDTLTNTITTTLPVAATSFRFAITIVSLDGAQKFCSFSTLHGQHSNAVQN